MRKRILFFLQAFLFVSIAYAQTVSDYLILQDIDRYKLTKGLLFRGRIVGAEPKVSRAGDEASGYYTSYETSYAGGEGYSAPKVEVRVYESTQWLLHEVERDFRNYYGIPGMSYGPRQIDGQSVMEDSVGGRNYRWLSSNKVIVIEYHDSQMTKPEPLEIVKAYLAKHPSTLPAMTLAQLRSTENKTKWIKNEMDRRLWLCDKWFMALQLGKAEQKAVLENTVDSMQVFLDYREKYYGISAKDDKIALSNYLYQNNGTAIRNKLSEYKTWWSVNKGKAINL